MKHIKMLGLLALAAMALVAFVGTTSASALSSFTAGEAGKTLKTKTLVQEVFTITGAETKCEITKFEGKTEGTLENGKVHSTTQRVHPVYEKCKAFGLEGTTINTKGCDYIFSADTTETTGKGKMANVELVDHPGEVCTGIVLEAKPLFTECIAVVPKQTINHAVRYTNTAGGKIDIKATATEIKTDVTKSTGLCPLTVRNAGTEGTYHEGAAGGTYTGESEVSAEGTEISWTE
jgi:hypothetical protein